MTHLFFILRVLLILNILLPPGVFAATIYVRPGDDGNGTATLRILILS